MHQQYLGRYGVPSVAANTLPQPDSADQAVRAFTGKPFQHDLMTLHGNMQIDYIDSKAAANRRHRQPTFNRYHAMRRSGTWGGCCMHSIYS